MIYKHDIFYRTNHLTLEDKINICTDAKLKGYHWWVDILDCRKSWMRQRIDMSFNRILTMLKEGTHFVVINRFPIIKIPFKGVDTYLEIGFRTMTGPDYFLWMYVDIKWLDFFTFKYGLEEII